MKPRASTKRVAPGSAGAQQRKADRLRRRDRSRVAATLRALLLESGDEARLRGFDIDAWIDEWMRVPLPELGGRSPAQAMRRAGGWPLVERALERMRGGLCA